MERAARFMQPTLWYLVHGSTGRAAHSGLSSWGEPKVDVGMEYMSVSIRVAWVGSPSASNRGDDCGANGSAKGAARGAIRVGKKGRTKYAATGSSKR